MTSCDPWALQGWRKHQSAGSSTHFCSGLPWLQWKLLWQRWWMLFLLCEGLRLCLKFRKTLALRSHLYLVLTLQNFSMSSSIWWHSGSVMKGFREWVGHVKTTLNLFWEFLCWFLSALSLTFWTRASLIGLRTNCHCNQKKKGNKMGTSHMAIFLWVSERKVERQTSISRRKKHKLTFHRFPACSVCYVKYPSSALLWIANTLTAV